MVYINGRSAEQVLNDYRNLFALKKDGNFKTSVGSTTGYLYADETGLKSITGFRASAKAVASGVEARNRAMRTELLQAFTACHASRRFLEFVRLRLGLNDKGRIDAGNMLECSKPLSRRTVKYLLESFKSGTCTVTDDEGNREEFKTFIRKTGNLGMDGAGGLKETSVHGAKDWILNAYRKLPANVNSILTDGDKVRYDEDELESMKGILTSTFRQTEFSPGEMTFWVMQTHDRKKLPQQVQEGLASYQEGIAKFLSEGVTKYFRGREKGLNPLVARLLADQSFMRHSDSFGAIAIASRIFDKLQAEEPESLKGKDPMVVLYQKVAGPKEENPNEDEIPSSLGRALRDLFFANHEVLGDSYEKCKEFARGIVDDLVSGKEIGRPTDPSVREAVKGFLPSVLKDSAATLPEVVTEANLPTCLNSVSAHARRTAAVLMALLSNANAGPIVSRVSGSESRQNLMQSVLNDPHVARVLSAPDEGAFERGLGDLLTDADLKAHLDEVLNKEKQRLDAEDARLAGRQTTAAVKTLLKNVFVNEPLIRDAVDKADWAEDALHDAAVSEALVTRFRGLIELRDNKRILPDTFKRFVQESLVSPKFAKKMPNFVTDLFADAAQVDLPGLAKNLAAWDVEKGYDFAFDLARKILTVLSRAGHDKYLEDVEDRSCAAGILVQAWADASPEDFRTVRDILSAKAPNGNASLAEAICDKIHREAEAGVYERAPDIELDNGQTLKPRACSVMATNFLLIIGGAQGNEIGHLRMVS